MPQVGNKKFPYTPSGIRQAKQAYDRKQKFGAALNQLRGSRPAGPATNLRRAEVEASNQKMAEAQPSPMDQTNRVRQAVPTQPSFSRPPMRVPGNVRLPKPGNPRPRPAGGVRPKGAVGPGQRGIRPFPQNYRPIRKKMM